MGSRAGGKFSCQKTLNWVLKLFSFRDIMSKARIDNSGGNLSPRPFFAKRYAARLLNLAVESRRDIPQSKSVSRETFFGLLLQLLFVRNDITDNLIQVYYHCQ